MQSTDGGNTFFDPFTSFEKSPSAPVLALHRNNLFIGWRGEQDQLDLGVIGVRNGSIVGWSPNSPYRDLTYIDNFAVKPGDLIVCTAYYAADLSAGSIAMGNISSGEHFAITLLPPPSAELKGTSVEWIMEAPGYKGTIEALAQFTPVQFSYAIGCGPNGLANPGDGFIWNLIDQNNDTLAAGVLGNEEVTIDYLF